MKRWTRLGGCRALERRQGCARSGRMCDLREVPSRCYYLGLHLTGSDGKGSACQAGDPRSIPGSGRFPWRREQQPPPVFLPGKFHGPRRLVNYSPWSCKESDTTELLSTLIHLCKMYMHLAHKAPDLQLAGWRPRKNNLLVQAQRQGRSHVPAQS